MQNAEQPQKPRIKLSPAVKQILLRRAREVQVQRLSETTSASDNTHQTLSKKKGGLTSGYDERRRSNFD